ncbi:ankyrin repeat-containing domain protein [Emericellopsis atlantica]|uniref:Ankyrin repeat-containing domain protein n=1 Tax=Emericellopsis atlantica TaxID=2614577 RepID=A0A9P8CMN8_9HYPO|nr:ankyrin repeat-containing domain protein [Emericellopsis atlantica]KAG9250891.1 ankyrin repeat-containing domain protein [Emericellopsis atlantica]
MQERLAILDWLSTIDHAAHQNDAFAKHQAGTGQWLLDSLPFKEWMAAAEPEELFCPGMPGAGKTVLSSVVIDHLQSLAEGERIGVAYVYCDYRRVDEQTTRDVLASLLRQLAQGLASIPRPLKELYTACRTKPRVDQLLAMITSITGLYSKVSIVVDALDEARETDGFRQQLISSLHAIQADGKTKLFLTSRFNPDVIGMLETSRTIEIRATPDDVKLYLEGHMSQLPAFVGRSPALQDEVKTGISNAVDGMFLLAKLYLDSLRGKRSPKAMRTAIQQLYAGSEAYDRAYDDAMERIRSQGPDQEELAKQVLSWIVRATRALKKEELQHALAVELAESDLDEDNLPQVEDMVAVCAGLVAVDENGDTIHLVHYTTQEYFARTWEQWFPTAEEDIVKICATYLMFDAIQQGPFDSRRRRELRMKGNPLLEYACNNWGHHAIKYGEPCAEVLAFLRSPRAVVAASEVVFTDDPLRLWKTGLSFWTKSEKGNAEKLLALHLASYFGVEYAVRALLEEGHEPDLPNPWGRTPISLAAEQGNDDVMRMLLETGRVDADSRDVYGRTPLSWAAEMGSLSTVQFLLDEELPASLFDFTRAAREAEQTKEGQQAPGPKKCAVDDRSRDDKGWTPLTHACYGGRLDIARLFLDRGTPVDSETAVGETPLMYAANRGAEGIVTMLLERGASPNHKSHNGGSPLQRAVRGEQEGTARLLLEAGADARTADKAGETPLHIVTKLPLAILMIEYGADINARDEKNQTPLRCLVATYGRESLVELFLSHGADVHARDEQGMTALAAATSPENVGLLLANGAIVDSRDNNGRTPLSYKKSAGAVRLLLEHGADVHVRCNVGRTPLSYIGTDGVLLDEAVENASALVKHGAHVNSRCDVGRTPLSYVAGRGSRAEEAIGRALVELGGDVNTMDNRGRTPLWHTAACESPNVYRSVMANELIQLGADVNLPDEDGRTALQVAAQADIHGKKELVQLLLASGATWETDGPEGEYISDLLSGALRTPTPVEDEEDLLPRCSMM